MSTSSDDGVRETCPQPSLLPQLMGRAQATGREEKSHRVKRGDAQQGPSAAAGQRGHRNKGRKVRVPRSLGS